jgi:hypothetical protein
MKNRKLKTNAIYPHQTSLKGTKPRDPISRRKTPA